jgi:hypothetical protein
MAASVAWSKGFAYPRPGLIQVRMNTAASWWHRFSTCATDLLHRYLPGLGIRGHGGEEESRATGVCAGVLLRTAIGAAGSAVIVATEGPVYGALGGGTIRSPSAPHDKKCNAPLVSRVRLAQVVCVVVGARGMTRNSAIS